MDSSWAAEHLQVIRTLMERAAVYRRALAPIMLMLGGLGLAAAAVGWWQCWETSPAFGTFWGLVSLTGLFLALLLVRRQAWRADEPFWSPPTRRVIQAMLPALFAGLVAVVWLLNPARSNPSHAWWLLPVWMVLYGCALHAAGFFMPRGIKLFGWLFILAGCALALFLSGRPDGALPPLRLAHVVMGAVFGGMHLAYGVYLTLTEKGKQTV